MLMHAPNPALAPDELDGLRYPMLASEKLDGFRIVIMGNVLLTKSGVPHVNRNLASHFADLLALSREGWVFDCECWCPGMTLPEIQPILQSRYAEIPAAMSAYIFDAITLSAFYSSRSPRFERRIAAVSELIAARRPAHAVVHPHRVVGSASEAAAFFDEVTLRGGEGLMLRDPSGTYHHGRCTRRQGLIYKLKPTHVARAA